MVPDIRGQPSLPSSSNPPGDSLYLPLLPNLPFDLAVEILCRLPVKSLLQLRYVCKSWNSLISDPKFAKKHLRYSMTNFTHHHLILSNFSYCSRKLSFTTYPLLSVLNTAAVAAPTAIQLEYPRPWDSYKRFDEIVGSCHGIFCIHNDDVSDITFLWSPSTRRSKQLPPLGNLPLKRSLKRLSYTVYGFAYDHIFDICKTVAIFCYLCDNGDFKTQVNVHTLGTHSWRRIQEFPLDNVLKHSGTYVSGTLNWLSSYDSNMVVVSLNLGKESYQKLIQPITGLAAVTLEVLRDCLCIISNEDSFSDVWLMKEYGNKESWTKLFTIRQLGSYYAKILHMPEDEEVLLKLRESLALYNFKNGTFKTAHIQNIDDSLVGLEVYVESLISPCSL